MVLRWPLNPGAPVTAALRLAGPGVGEPAKSRPVFTAPQWKALPHSPYPRPSFTGSFIPVCFCYTVNPSDKDPLGERAQEKGRFREAGMQRPTGEAEAYSSERGVELSKGCGLLISHRGWCLTWGHSRVRPFLLLVWHGGKSHVLYRNLSQGKSKEPSDVWLPSYTPTPTFPPAALRLVPIALFT